MSALATKLTVGMNSKRGNVQYPNSPAEVGPLWKEKKKDAGHCKPNRWTFSQAMQIPPTLLCQWGNNDGKK